MNALRAELRRALGEMMPSDRSSESGDICRKLRNEIDAALPSVIAAFYPLPFEVQILPALDGLMGSGIQLAFPRVEDRTSEMVFHLADPSLSSHWDTGPMGLRQPAPGLPVWIPQSSHDLFLVPGLGFGLQGERIGRGAGHYDRYLSMKPGFRLGIGFDRQLLDSLPQRSWDQRLDGVLTGFRRVGRPF